MAVYIDQNKREWNIHIDIAACKRVKKDLNFDILSVDDAGNALTKLSTDFVLLADVLWSIARPEAEKRHISEEDFLKGLEGDAFEKAIEAFAKAYIDFFPHKRREVLAQAWKKINAIQEIALERAKEQIEAATLGN